MTAPTVLFLSEAAAEVRVSVDTLRRAIRQRQLAATKKAGRWRIKRTELMRWAEASDEGRLAAVPARVRSANAPTEHGSDAYLWDRLRAARS